MMKLHMIGTHPKLKDTLENMEGCPNNEARKDQERNKEVDPDKDESCSKTLYNFLQQEKCQKTYQNTSQWNWTTLMPRL